MAMHLVLRSINGARAKTCVFSRLAPACVFPQHSAPTTCMATSAKEQMEAFWNKNLNLNRPISPFLEIYAPQVTWTLSITHRITGCAVAAGVVIFSLFELLTSDPFLVHFQYIKDMGLPTWYIYGSQFMVAFAFSFHFCNGLRHLAWDAHKLLSLKEIYTSGYAMLIMTFLMVVFLFCLKSYIVIDDPAKRRKRNR